MDGHDETEGTKDNSRHPTLNIFLKGLFVKFQVTREENDSSEKIRERYRIFHSYEVITIINNKKVYFFGVHNLRELF